MSILDKINGPKELKTLNLVELDKLCQEIREKIISVVAKTGGHLASSLGVVELTVALLYTFNPPTDKIIWDVGHQSYTYKLLTERRKKFEALRQHGGIAGFPKRSESPYDSFGTGHSSTSISAALGMAEAKSLQKKDNKVIAIIGDGSFMAGLALEGLNHAGHRKQDLIIILNDNEMSISPTIGALSSYISNIITGSFYNRLREKVRKKISSIPRVGNSLFKIVSKVEESLKGIIIPSILFEELGFRYIGPIPGHRLDYLISTFENIRNLKGAILLHVLTKKGKGYKPAELDPITFHGIGPFDKERGIPYKKSGSSSYTEVFGQALIELAEENPKIIAITAGMSNGTGLDKFAKIFPDRFYDVGIAEQHAITFAAGLAAEGFRPVVVIYSTFIQRAYDQIIHDVCLQNLPVIFALDRAGIVGEDGPTHNGLFDLSFLRIIPNMIVMSPKDKNELRNLLFTSLNLSSPSAIRYPRGEGYGVITEPGFTPLEVGKAEILLEGDDIAIFAVGSTVYPSLEAASILQKEGLKLALVNFRFIKPIDEEAILYWAEKTGNILTVEENVLAGGFGSAVTEVMGKREILNTRVKSLGIADTFVEHGDQKLLRNKYRIDVEGIVNASRKLKLK